MPLNSKRNRRQVAWSKPEQRFWYKAVRQGLTLAADDCYNSMERLADYWTEPFTYEFIRKWVREQMFCYHPQDEEMCDDFWYRQFPEWQIGRFKAHVEWLARYHANRYFKVMYQKGRVIIKGIEDCPECKGSGFTGSYNNGPDDNDMAPCCCIDEQLIVLGMLGK